MSTHNIGFYEDLTKIIFELSSNIIKYAPYFFCCIQASIIKKGSDQTLMMPILICSFVSVICIKLVF